MAVKTPIRTVFDGSGNATGLAEYQSGEFIGLSHGGIGAALSIGTAGQVLKVNSGASALEFGSVEAIVNIDGATNLESATLAVGDKLLLSDGGTEGRVLLSQIDTLFISTTQTLTNKTINSNANTLHIDLDDLGTFTGTLAEFNSGLQGDSFVSLTGSETLTNKILTSPTVSGLALSDSSIVFEGSGADDHETTFTVTNPTADRTITLPNATGHVAVFATAPTAAITDGSEGQALITDGSGALSFATISASFPESTFLTAPGSSGDFDLAKVPAQTGSVESGFTALQQDAFGIALDETVFSCMDPKGSTDTVDLGAFS